MWPLSAYRAPYAPLFPIANALQYGTPPLVSVTGVAPNLDHAKSLAFYANADLLLTFGWMAGEITQLTTSTPPFRTDE